MTNDYLFEFIFFLILAYTCNKYLLFIKYLMYKSVDIFLLKNVSNKYINEKKFYNNNKKSFINLIYEQSRDQNFLNDNINKINHCMKMIFKNYDNVYCGKDGNFSFVKNFETNFISILIPSSDFLKNGNVMKYNIFKKSYFYTYLKYYLCFCKFWFNDNKGEKYKMDKSKCIEMNNNIYNKLKINKNVYESLNYDEINFILNKRNILSKKLFDTLTYKEFMNVVKLKCDFDDEIELLYFVYVPYFKDKEVKIYYSINEDYFNIKDLNIIGNLEIDNKRLPFVFKNHTKKVIFDGNLFTSSNNLKNSNLCVIFNKNVFSHYIDIIDIVLLFNYFYVRKIYSTRNPGTAFYYKHKKYIIYLDNLPIIADNNEKLSIAADFKIERS
jgi:hypothetical protein